MAKTTSSERFAAKSEGGQMTEDQFAVEAVENKSILGIFYRCSISLVIADRKLGGLRSGEPVAGDASLRNQARLFAESEALARDMID